jgi:hypothetical protein
MTTENEWHGTVIVDWNGVLHPDLVAIGLVHEIIYDVNEPSHVTRQAVLSTASRAEALAMVITIIIFLLIVDSNRCPLMEYGRTGQVAAKTSSAGLGRGRPVRCEPLRASRSAVCLGAPPPGRLPRLFSRSM